MAAQVADELKTVIHATPPMEERRKKERKKESTLFMYVGLLFFSVSRGNSAAALLRGGLPHVSRVSQWMSKSVSVRVSKSVSE